MATVRADHVIFVITSKTQIFKIIAAYFAFEFINRHVQDPPEFRRGTNHIYNFSNFCELACVYDNLGLKPALCDKERSNSRVTR
jgi:hypothetical protein